MKKRKRPSLIGRIFLPAPKEKTMDKKTNGKPQPKTDLYLALPIIICLMLIFGGPAMAEEQTTYKIATVPWAGWSPLLVAEAKGFWAEQGIEVKIVNIEVEDIPPLIKKGVVHFAMDMVGSVVGKRIKGEPAIIVAETDWSDGGDRIIVKKDLDLKTVENKIMGVYLNSPAITSFVNRYLKTKGLSFADFKVVELNTNKLTDLFIEGRFPIIVNYDPAALKAAKDGAGLEAANSGTYPGSIPECMYTYENIIEKISSEDLAKILLGWAKGAAWANDPANWPEFQQILNQKVFKDDKPYSEAELKEIIQAVRIHTPQQLADRNKTGGGLQQYLDELRTFLKDNGMLQKEFTNRELFDNRYIMGIVQ